MLTYPDINPVAVSLGAFKIHWYGITYLISFVGAWWFGRLRAKQAHSPISPAQMEDLIFYGAIGVILGGRLGYTFFYNLPAFLDNPLILFQVWKGGMAFHGGLIGVLIAMWLYARKVGSTFFRITDFIAPLVPIGLLSGRIGNFINGELWGGPTDSILGMQVLCAKSVATEELCQRVGTPNDSIYSLPVHASQLYEAALEGVVLFMILWIFSAKQRPLMSVSGLFLLGYGLFRFSVEFVRMPDAHIGYLAFDWFTMGQLLTLPMILFGLLLLALAYRNKETA